MSERIDSHQHFWRYDPQEYDWIDDAMAQLRRDFLPADLQPLLAAREVAGCVAVQARQTLAETRWLLELAEANTWIRGVVGWVDLRSAQVDQQLAEVAAHPRLCGIRHIVQAEPDPEFVLRDDFQRGLRALARFDLVYDVLVLPPQLRAATELCRRFPAQRFVLDHLAKPYARRGELEPWRAELRALAALPNVSCKLSGLVTEADWQRWTPAGLQPYVDTALDAFGPERLLFGSDWPVCLVASDYGRWFDTVAAWTAALAPAEQAAVLGGNAARIYRLGDAAGLS